MYGSMNNKSLFINWMLWQYFILDFTISHNFCLNSNELESYAYKCVYIFIYNTNNAN